MRDTISRLHQCIWWIETQENSWGGGQKGQGYWQGGEGWCRGCIQSLRKCLKTPSRKQSSGDSVNGSCTWHQNNDQGSNKKFNVQVSVDQVGSYKPWKWFSQRRKVPNKRVPGCQHKSHGTVGKFTEKEKLEFYRKFVRFLLISFSKCLD